MDDRAFYEAWVTSIQKYGIYNPYNGRGAIKNLRPHGPHSVRDVKATHVLKSGGTVSDAADALLDTEDMVRQHYARWLPDDRNARVRERINQEMFGGPAAIDNPIKGGGSV